MAGARIVSAGTLARLAFVLLLALLHAPGVAGYGLIFDALSTWESVAVFGTHLPLGRGSTNTLLTSAPLCDRGGKIPRQQKRIEDDPRNFTCVFNGRVETRAQHVTVQAVRCDHPPPAVREALYGKPVTLRINKAIAVTHAVYTPIPEDEKRLKLMQTTLPAERRPPKKYFLCSCLQIWNRAEFLLEWLLYFVDVLGVERLFVYDNDSSAFDDLDLVVRWLARGYNVDLYDWPKSKTQVAFNGHCALRARRECEWVTFTDVDEFVYLPPWLAKDHKLSTFLHSLPPDTGGVSLRMRNFVDDLARIGKPLGGVARNYDCFFYKLGNTKHIVRADAIHASLFTSAHYYCYDSHYRFKSVTNGAYLYHFRTQAWSVFKKKYMRRAGLGSRSFKLPPGVKPTDENPSAEFLGFKGACSKGSDKYKRSLRVYEVYLCRATLKLPKAGCSEALAGPDGADSAEQGGGGPPRAAASQGPVLITGTGGVGSGLKGVAAWLKGHLGPGSRVRVSWEVAGSSPEDSQAGGRPMRFKRVFHQVQHPLQAISAATTLPAAAWAFIERHSPIVRQSLPIVQRALYFWVAWNFRAEILADQRFRVEDVNLEDLCRTIGLKLCHKSKNHIPIHTTEIAADVTWAILDAIDVVVANMARDMARSYGYEGRDLERNATRPAHARPDWLDAAEQAEAEIEEEDGEEENGGEEVEEEENGEEGEGEGQAEKGEDDGDTDEDSER